MAMTNGNADQVRPARDQDGFDQVPAQEEKTKGRKAAKQSRFACRKIWKHVAAQLTLCLLLAATPEAIAMAAAYIELFIEEAVNRCILLAKAEGDESLDLSHIERILPQLLLDF